MFIHRFFGLHIFRHKLFKIGNAARDPVSISQIQRLRCVVSNRHKDVLHFAFGSFDLFDHFPRARFVEYAATADPVDCLVFNYAFERHIMLMFTGYFLKLFLRQVSGSNKIFKNTFLKFINSVRKICEKFEIFAVFIIQAKYIGSGFLPLFFGNFDVFHFVKILHIPTRNQKIVKVIHCLAFVRFNVVHCGYKVL